MTTPRALLPITFGPFFRRFRTLTPVQEQAIPEILGGKDVLISAPTASGKTEAFAAPAAEFVRGGPRGGLRVLIVSPTRALANDLFRRLEQRMTDVSVGFGRYTGEHKDLKAGGLPEIAIATPEALDSLLARRSASLKSLRLVILDEVHFLDGTPRGDQLRILLHRVEAVAAHRPQRLAVSATIENPAAFAARYLDRAKIVDIRGVRRILVREFEGDGRLHIAAHVNDLAKSGFRKILVFCNRRADVESVTAELRRSSVFQDQVYPHHGSLSQTVRERTEARFLTAPSAVAVATMTLEMGIDIGSVDYVLLIGLPSGVANLLQRIGRGNRRTSETRAGFTVASPADAIVGERMFRALKDGRLLGRPYAFRPSVISQQALVIAAAHGWVDAPLLAKAIPRALLEESAPLELHELLEALAEHGDLETSRGHRFVPSEKTEEAYVRGHLHSNIDSEPDLDVIDRVSGEIIGKMPAFAGARLHLGGGSRRVVSAHKGAILTDAVAGATVAKFTSRGIPLTSFALARHVVLSHGVKDDAIPIFDHGNAQIVLHGLGTVGQLFFAHLLDGRLDGERIERLSAFGAVVTGGDFRLPEPPKDAFQTFVKNEEVRLAKFCAMGPWHRILPRAARVEAVRRAAGTDELVAFLERARLVRIHPDARDRVRLADLVPVKRTPRDEIPEPG